MNGDKSTRLGFIRIPELSSNIRSWITLDFLGPSTIITSGLKFLLLVKIYSIILKKCNVIGLAVLSQENKMVAVDIDLFLPCLINIKYLIARLTSKAPHSMKLSR